jgi:hypothetical protein
MYDPTVATLTEARKLWRGMSPSSVLGGAVSAVGMFLTALRRLRALTDGHGGAFASVGFRRFFAMIARARRRLPG